MKSVIAALLLSLAWPAAGYAQTTTEGTIRGVVRDGQGGVLPGVVVTASSPAVARPAVATTGADGSYRLINLAPGEYTVTAELQGFSRHQRGEVTVRASLNLNIDIVMAIGGMNEVVEVKAETPMLEVQKPVQAVNISGDLQRSLPLGMRRDYSDFLEVTPGVQARSYNQGTGGQVYMMRGSEVESHVVQIEGADVGSFYQGMGALYVGFSSDAIADTQVKTGAVDASAPLGVGAVINIATQSGTNQLKGSVSGVYQSKSWNGDNAAAGARSVFTQIGQADLALGGPIAKDRLFYFGSFRLADRQVGVYRTAAQIAALRGVYPGFSEFANGGTSKYYFAKATALLSPRHQFLAFFQRDFNPEVAGAATDSKDFSIAAFGGSAVGVRLSSVWGAALTTRMNIAYNDKAFNGSFSAFDGHTFSGPEQDVYSSSFVSGGRRVGNGFLGLFNNLQQLAAIPASKLTAQIDGSFYHSGAGGSHEVQFGVLLQPQLSVESQIRYANNGTAFEELSLADPNNLSSAQQVFHRRVYDAPQITSFSLLAKDFGFYLQDAWKPTHRLTIDAGIRVDNIRVRDRVFGVDTQNSWEVGPRVGATLMLTDDAKNVVRGSYGRVSEQAQYIYLPTAGGNPVGFTDSYDNNLDGVFETVLRTPPVTPQSTNQIVDPKRHMPYVEEFIGGYRRQLPGQASVDVSVVRRYYRERPALVEQNRVINGVAFAGYKDVSQNDIFLVTNNTWNTQVYSGLEISVAKRTPWLNLLGGYTRSWQHLDGTWIPGDPASFVQPSAFANDAGIGTIRGQETNSLSGAADTRSPSWLPHTFRVGGSVSAPMGLQIASNLVVLSGPFSGPIVNRIAAADPQFGPATVTLSNGRVVANPLATTIRFAYATRGEGQISAPTLVTLNLRVGRDFQAGPRKLSVAVDVNNLLNGASDQQFQAGGNQLYNTTNFAQAPDGSFRGTNRQPPRSAQISARFVF